MLIIEMAKMEFTGGHIEIVLFKEITKIKLTGGHIRSMLIKETSKSELTTAILDYQNEIGFMIGTKIKY